MLIAPSVHLTTRTRGESPLWELSLRYAAATAATLLAIAGAQLELANSFIWILTGLTLVGVPVSIFLRLNDMKIRGFSIPRPLLNSLTVLSTFGAATYFVFWSMRAFLAPVFTGQQPFSYWMNFAPSEPIRLLMQVFLLFAAFRSFAIISDKDATLTTVPSFSVLLLLIPIQRGIEVVLYFVAWIFVAMILFALDHRSEVRERVDLTVPAISPGQDVKLGARSLATVMMVSLLAAGGISMLLSLRDPEEQSSTGSAISVLATRLTNMAMAIPEVSVNSGPERQIDFTSGPALPSRAALWQVSARLYGGKSIRPTYWRMFGLNTYNGKSWLQGETGTTPVPRSYVTFARYPPIFFFDSPNSLGYQNSTLSPSDSVPGYDVGRSNPKVGLQFGKPVALVRQTLTAIVPNIGFIPVQPSVRAIVLRESDQKEVRLRNDGAVDVGVVQAGQTVRLQSDIPPLPEYGVFGNFVPVKSLSEAQVAASKIVISPSQRIANLQLPATLPQRVRNLGRSMLRGASPSSSNYARAQRIAIALQNNAVYTLRPPAIPEGRDATDFFLFDGSKRGYCTYFAGALTVLCRTQNIPARVVSGFGGIQWVGPETGLLREANAHAWTEVWVDGFGWAVVDATPAGDRGDNSPTWLENWGDLFNSGLSNTALWVRHRLLSMVLVLGALVSGILFLKLRKHRFGGWSRRDVRDDDLERRAVRDVYRTTARRVARKHRPKFHWETPDEWAKSCSSMFSLADVEELRHLTLLYLAARYTNSPLPGGSAKSARQIAARISGKRLKTG